jgi:aminoglycoside phosphotransferase (APT) family kinase protein
VRGAAKGATGAGQPYLAMEWLEGETLSERLSRGTLTLDESLDLAGRVALTLGRLHRLGVVHRDLKPSNDVLLTRAAKIGDPVWRERFLRNVPGHARTLELCERRPGASPPR